MSTFKGTVSEFPEIRIDFFRNSGSGQPPPLACFLSHVHSDHLQGLESLKSPFVYCSPATREILLRLEKYPHRMNFAKGILETTVQTYKHLRTILKTIPLETPTTIELSPGNEIRVTLFDANHCIGAVMFLIQGNGKAILYTGDIRSEPWWVNSLVQNPVLLPYTLGNKRLENIYLDTTFASKADPYREFPSKAEGLRELLEKVERYPENTVFYVEAWTFGYENVWIALSSLLQSPVHLDRYRWGIYRSLLNKNGMPECVEASPLVGYPLGNHRVEGCLTPNSKTRLHSCERETGCHVDEKKANAVRIVPIVTRLANGTEMHEMGIGGGKGDLDKTFELELDDAGVLSALFQLCAARISDKDELLQVFSLLNSFCQPEKPHLRLDLEMDLNKAKLDELVDLLRERALVPSDQDQTARKSAREKESTLPQEITFPYSRHSSYLELCALVGAFRPREVFPCSVDEARWTQEVSMRSLFAHLCSGNVFTHDVEMMNVYEERQIELCGDEDRSERESQAHTQSFSQRSTGGAVDEAHDCSLVREESQIQEVEIREEFFTPFNNLPMSSPTLQAASSLPPSQAAKRSIPTTSSGATEIEGVPRSFTNTISPPKRQRRNSGKSIRQWAYHAAASLDERCDGWDSFGGLTCVQSEKNKDIELGDDY